MNAKAWRDGATYTLVVGSIAISVDTNGLRKVKLANPPHLAYTPAADSKRVDPNDTEAIGLFRAAIDDAWGAIDAAQETMDGIAADGLDIT